MSVIDYTWEIQNEISNSHNICMVESNSVKQKSEVITYDI